MCINIKIKYECLGLTGNVPVYNGYGYFLLEKMTMNLIDKLIFI